MKKLIVLAFSVMLFVSCSNSTVEVPVTDSVKITVDSLTTKPVNDSTFVVDTTVIDSATVK